jgi:hypothetical protein
MFSRLSKAGRTTVCSTSCNRALSASGLALTARLNDTLAPPYAVAERKKKASFFEKKEAKKIY